MTTTHATGATAGQLTIPCPSCGRWNRIMAARVADRPKCGACAQTISLDRPLALTDATFDRVIAESGVSVLVDFYADWCGPCKMMAPAIDELARMSIGAALVAKLDTDASPRTATRYQIRGIPTVIVFSGGHEVTRQSGVLSLAALQAMVR